MSDRTHARILLALIVDEREDGILGSEQRIRLRIADRGYIGHGCPPCASKYNDSGCYCRRLTTKFSRRWPAFVFAQQYFQTGLARTGVK